MVGRILRTLNFTSSSEHKANNGRLKRYLFHAQIEFFLLYKERQMERKPFKNDDIYLERDIFWQKPCVVLGGEDRVYYTPTISHVE